MEAITIRLSEDLLESLDGEADEYEQSRSEYIREILRSRNEYDQLQDEYEDLERENERLRRQLEATNKRVDEHTELVEYIEQERSLQERREERRNAPVWTRAKWWILGKGEE